MVFFETFLTQKSFILRGLKLIPSKVYFKNYLIEVLLYAQKTYNFE